MSTKTETLHDCPRCGTKNFTANGLASHNCDKHKARRDASLAVSGRKPLTLATLAELPPVVGNEDAEMGRQLTAQWERVKDSRKQDLIFGAMMLKVRERVDSARGANSATRGPTTKGTGLKGWITEFAPCVSEGVAYRLMDIAEGIRESFKLGAKVDLEALLTAQVESLDTKLAGQREKIEEMIEGRSQRQLLLEFGNAEPKHRLGGDTTPKDGTVRPRADKADQAQAHFHGLQELLFRCISPASIALTPYLPGMTDEPDKVASLTHLIEFTSTLKTALQDALKIVKGRTS